MNVEERFLTYVSFDTQSDEHSETTPSTLKQLELAKYLVKEMQEIGIQHTRVDEYGIVYGTIPATQGYEDVEHIGFIAHMDTSPDMSGSHVSPRIISSYDGGIIVLNEDLQITMNPVMFESLRNKKGHDLIVSDGTTLLGADDKAGIAEIMTMAEHLINDKIAHGTIQIAFTPDEEVGRGTEHFDVEAFQASFAYTVDGGPVNCIDYENFNAASAVINIQGSSIHPGDAKHKMLNASLIAMEFHGMLPVNEDPAYTEGYEGFHHLTDMSGTCENAQLSYIIRDHNALLFERKKRDFRRITSYLNEKYSANTIQLDLQDSYANMRNIIEKNMHIVSLVKDVMKELDLHPESQAIRGGTDGARLTYEGLPCPNLGTGGYNYHGKYEFASIQEMQMSVKILLGICEKVTTMKQ